MEPFDSSTTPVPDMPSTGGTSMSTESSEAPAKEMQSDAAKGESGASDGSGSTTTGSPHERQEGDGGNPVPGGEKVDSDITNGTPASRADTLDGELLKEPLGNDVI